MPSTSVYIFSYTVQYLYFCKYRVLLPLQIKCGKKIWLSLWILRHWTEFVMHCDKRKIKSVTILFSLLIFWNTGSTFQPWCVISVVFLFVDRNEDWTSAPQTNIANEMNNQERTWAHFKNWWAYDKRRKSAWAIISFEPSWEIICSVQKKKKKNVITCSIMENDSRMIVMLVINFLVIIPHKTHRCWQQTLQKGFCWFIIHCFSLMQMWTVLSVIFT